MADDTAPPASGPEPRVLATRTLSTRRKLVYALVATVLLLGGVEVALRATTTVVGRASIPDQRVKNHLQGGALTYDADLGWVMNPQGFRHPRRVDPERVPGSWRAVALGDSQTVGPGLSLEQSWPLQAEALLQQRHPDVPVQVISGAVPGYSSLQALRQVQDRLAWLQPEVWLVDCRAKDAQRDDGLRPLGIERYLFQWRTYYVLRFALERLQGNTRPMPTAAPVDRPDLGNHDLILDAARARGSQVLFLDYPVWVQNEDRILCAAPPEELPEGAAVARGCEALIASGLPPASLFFDNNHLKAEGSAIVGAAVADALDQLGLGPAARP